MSFEGRLHAHVLINKWGERLVVVFPEGNLASPLALIPMEEWRRLVDDVIGEITQLGKK